MTWEEYRLSFIEEAHRQNKDQEYISACLSYAEPLHASDLPIIFDLNHFSMLVGCKVGYVSKMSHAPEFFYRTFQIQKRNGKLRDISEPLPDLKRIQHWIYKEILAKVKVSIYAKGFVKEQSIKANARFHRKQQSVLTIDIKDFFPSVSFFKIFNAFRKLGYSKNVSTILANLCSIDNQLPQGAPTSPMLSNIIFYPIDEKIADFVKRHKWRYTRYADDLTFSGNLDVAKVLSFVRSILEQYGFKINNDKTRIANRNARQEITGIVANEKLQVCKPYRKRIRQEVYYITKYGLDSHLYKTHETRKNYLYHLVGKIAFALYINPHDTEMKKYYEFVKQLVRANATS